MFTVWGLPHATRYAQRETDQELKGTGRPCPMLVGIVVRSMGWAIRIMDRLRETGA